ncbi:hypothetical protein [Fodinibius halophilus]|uniref:Uncharacterized protein n=1 Tax=Fodinibius halophilus TaxID=1736908 RepID=A0A6M1TIP9_9BACT|nr:hypothetical protein [Fodinibius halophilus]NGP89922.1 hypothetical protein [Fodinibius halophilus]
MSFQNICFKMGLPFKKKNVKQSPSNGPAGTSLLSASPAGGFGVVYPQFIAPLPIL